MQVRDIKRLLDVLGDTDVRELTLETGEYKLTVKRGLDAAAPVAHFAAAAPGVAAAAPQSSNAGAAGPAPGAVTAGAAAAAEAPVRDERLVEVVAPIVGTFYSAPSPDAPPYVRVGEKVKPGTVLCIIEAMKLMNEIDAEFPCTILEILVENGEPVEYGDKLFRVKKG